MRARLYTVRISSYSFILMPLPSFLGRLINLSIPLLNCLRLHPRPQWANRTIDRDRGRWLFSMFESDASRWRKCDAEDERWIKATHARTQLENSDKLSSSHPTWKVGWQKGFLFHGYLREPARTFEQAISFFLGFYSITCLCVCYSLDLIKFTLLVGADQ